MTAITYSNIGVFRPSIVKPPASVKDYTFDWTDRLEVGDSIQSYTVEVSGVTLESDSRSGALVTAWIGGGTLGAWGSARCHIQTVQGREDDQTIYFLIRET